MEMRRYGLVLAYMALVVVVPGQSACEAIGPKTGRLVLKYDAGLAGINLGDTMYDGTIYVGGEIAGLGVDAVWISPFFKSPMADFGYDVADHCAVDPVFGTEQDLLELGLQASLERPDEIAVDPRQQPVEHDVECAHRVDLRLGTLAAGYACGQHGRERDGKESEGG